MLRSECWNGTFRLTTCWSPCSGAIVEDYPEDTPFPSRLTLGWVGQRPVHVVWATAPGMDRIVIITVYEPDPEEWDSTFQRRRT